GPLRRRRDHQKGTQKLARRFASNVHLAASDSRAFDDHGRAAVVEFTTDAGAERRQRAAQLADWPLAHPRVSIETIRSPAQRAQRGEKADAGAAVLEEQFCFTGRGCAATALDTDRRLIRIMVEGNAEPLQTLDHHPCVLTVEDAG